MEGYVMKALGICKIFQKNNHNFVIEWSDGVAKEYRLSDLQQRCPCANCVDELTGKRKRDEKSVQDDVRAIRIVSVGRYALKIHFSSGCSTGIYSFDMLRELGKK